MLLFRLHVKHAKDYSWLQVRIDDAGCIHSEVLGRIFDGLEAVDSRGTACVDVGKTASALKAGCFCGDGAGAISSAIANMPAIAATTPYARIDPALGFGRFEFPTPPAMI